MYEIIVCPIKRLYQNADEGDVSDVAALAVSSYNIDENKLEDFRCTLCLNFDDIINTTENNAISSIIAKRIAEYIIALPDDLDSLYVCCDSGESRSTAMAAAIMRYKGLDEMKIWKNPKYHPNPLVYKLLCDALGVNVDDDEVQSKMAINQKAFSDAVKK